jgi:TatD DNase family protein
MTQISNPQDIHNIFDSHCHYDDGAFDGDRDELLTRLLSDGSPVKYMMHACTDLQSAEFGIKTAEKFSNYYTSVGIHPENMENLPENYAETLRRLAAHPKVKAIGEIGLDYHYDGYDRNAQIELFENQLELARELNLPVIMHCRDATEDFVRLMEKHRPCGVVHCFSGSAETAEQLLKLGLYIGFTGVLTFKNAKKVKKAFSVVPQDRLLFETDCPYMAPAPFRGKRCTSDLIAYVACEAESLCGIPAQKLTDTANENAKRLFNIEA